MADPSTSLAAASLTFSILSFLLLAIALVFFLFPDFSNTIRAGISRVGSVDGGGSTLAMMGAFLGALSPDIALLSGFVSDIMNGAFRYSVTSIIGVIAVILHWIVGGLVHGFSSDASSGISNVASAVVSTATTAAEQLMGTGAEAAAAAATTRPSAPRRVRAPGSVSTMSSMPTPALGPTSILRTANLNPRPATGSITGPTGSRMSRSTQGRLPARFREGGGEEEQTGGGWVIPADISAKFNPCSIRGLGMFDISKSPMGMAALSSVFSVYLLDMTVNSKRPTSDVLVYLTFSGVVYGLNLYAYSKFKCYGETFGEIAKSTVLPMIIGLAAGSSGFAVLQSTFPSYLPLDPKGMNSPSSPSGKHATCAPPNDQDQFVCDAYKDGKRITTAVVA
jgi:hypothetical protein